MGWLPIIAVIALFVLLPFGIAQMHRLFPGIWDEDEYGDP